MSRVIRSAGKVPTPDSSHGYLEASPDGNRTIGAPSRLSDTPAFSSIELAPDLPVRVFTSTERWTEDRIKALALYCSDGRWGGAFDEFCHKHLVIPRYDRWAVPGGPAWLTAPDSEGSFQNVAHRQIDFLVQVHQLERIVLFTHFGCAYYTQRLAKTPKDCLDTQLNDIRAARDMLQQWHPQIRVETYLAMREASLLSFHQIAD